MEDEAADAVGFDEIAAAITADAGDVRTLANVLATKLADALPDIVTVERERKLFGGQGAVEAVIVTVDDRCYELRTRPRVETLVRHQVRGISLSSQPLPLDAWLEALSRQLAAYAQRNAAAREALMGLIS